MNWPTIRRATAEDLKALVAIETASLPNPWSPDAIAAELRQESAALWLALVQTSSPPAVGYAAFRHLPGEAELLRLAVVPSARRRGLARLLLTAGLTRAARQGAEFCHLEVGADNLAASELYRRFGFRPTGRRANYYPTGEAALLMTKTLDRDL